MDTKQNYRGDMVRPLLSDAAAAAAAAACAVAKTAILAEAGAAADEACAQLESISDPTGRYDALLRCLRDRNWPEAWQALDVFDPLSDGVAVAMLLHGGKNGTVVGRKPGGAYRVSVGAGWTRVVRRCDLRVDPLTNGDAVASRVVRGAAWNYGFNILDVGQVLNTGEQPLAEHPILWCGKPFTLRRVVVGGAGSAAIVAACSRLRVLCVAADEGQRAQAGDIWAGATPSDGFGALASECGWLLSSEAAPEDEGFPARLERLVQTGDRGAYGAMPMLIELLRDGSEDAAVVAALCEVTCAGESPRSLVRLARLLLDETRHLGQAEVDIRYYGVTFATVRIAAIPRGEDRLMADGLGGALPVADVLSRVADETALALRASGWGSTPPEEYLIAAHYPDPREVAMRLLRRALSLDEGKDLQALVRAALSLPARALEALEALEACGLGAIAKAWRQAMDGVGDGWTPAVSPATLGTVRARVRTLIDGSASGADLAAREALDKLDALGIRPPKR